MTTDDRIAEIEARLKKATSGPWHVSEPEVRTSAFVSAPKYGHVCNAPVPHADWHEMERNANSQARKNIDFIAHAPSDIRHLLDALKSARGEMDGYKHTLFAIGEMQGPQDDLGSAKIFAVHALEGDYETLKSQLTAARTEAAREMREACAKVADADAERSRANFFELSSKGDQSTKYTNACVNTARAIAANIRTLEPAATEEAKPDSRVSNGR